MDVRPYTGGMDDSRSETTKAIDHQGALPFPETSSSDAEQSARTRVSKQAWIERHEDLCVVWVNGAPWHRFATESKMDWRIAGANLVLADIATTVEVVRALDLNRDTLYRDRKRISEGGLPNLAAVRRGPKGPSKATPSLRARAVNYYLKGLTRAAIARKLGVGTSTVDRMLKGVSRPSRKPRQASLPELACASTQEADASMSPPLDPTDQQVENVLHEQAPAEQSPPERESLAETVTSSEARTEEAVPYGSSTTPTSAGHEEHPDHESNADSMTADTASEEKVAAPCEPATGPETQPPAEDASPEDATSAFVPTSPHPAETTERDLDRTAERVYARFGLISEAEVRFVSGNDLRFVGALLILPALVATGFFQGLEEVYGRLKNGFYGLRHTVMTLALMLVLRLKRTEHLAGVSPTALGRLLGLDRAPEVKTLRRRVWEIANQGKAAEFMQWFARHLARRNSEVIGFLYVDGHTRIYHGKRKLSKAYSTRKRLALPAATDIWVNDANGEPFFVVTGEVTQALTRQLLPLIEELKSEEVLPKGMRVTFIFDRGGWSPKLFKAIVDAEHDFITYRKGKYPRRPVREFAEHGHEVDTRTFSYMLRDGVVRLGVGREFRQVHRRDESGHQIAIVTSRRDLEAAEVVYRIGQRWRQENYFKYARQEFDLDALDTYAVEPEDPDRMVVNPKRTKLDRRIRTLRQEAGKLEAELGRAADANEESRRPTVRGFKIAHGSLRQELAKVREKIDKLIARRRSTPRRVTISEASADQGVQLEVEHKHFMHAVKMATCRAETSLLRLLDKHYRRNEDEGRALLREAFRSSGSLRVGGGELCVTLDPMSAPRRTRAIIALCDQLNEDPVRIPGTSLRLRFAVSTETGVSELAMAPCQEV